MCDCQIYNKGVFKIHFSLFLIVQSVGRNRGKTFQNKFKAENILC